MEVIDDIDNIRIDTTSGSNPFLIVEINNKNYQVKLPNYETSSMINEYIAHQIAINLSCIVPNGVFIKFEESDIKDSLEQIKQSNKFKFLYNDYDMSSIQNVDKEIILFGIEWIENTSLCAEDKEEFFEYLELTDNNDSFYSLYSYDLYLHNQDRHIKNILFYQNSDGSHIVTLIDHDRILGSNEGIGRLTELRDDFCCIKNMLNSYLYEYIRSDVQKEYILKYSKEIEKLEDLIIKNIFIDYLKNCTDNIKGFRHIKNYIEEFLIYRKDFIVDSCKKQEGNCYG